MAAAMRRSASSLGSAIMAEVDGAASLSAAGDRVMMFHSVFKSIVNLSSSLMIVTYQSKV